MALAYDNRSRAQNALGAAQNSASLGYLGPVITRLANDRRWVLPQTDDNQVIVNQSYPLQLLHSTPRDLLEALRINALGSSVKAYVGDTMPAAGADLTLTLGSVRSFGVRVRITDSPLNFKFGQYYITLKDNATTIAEVALLAAKVPADIIILGIANNGGQASAATIAQPVVVISGSANGSATVSSSTTVFAETLNLRDLGEIA